MRADQRVLGGKLAPMRVEPVPAVDRLPRGWPRAVKHKPTTDRAVRRCTGCGDWLWKTRPCPVCAELKAQSC